MSAPTFTRHQLLLRAALGAAATGGVASATPLVRSALAQSGRIDVEVVQFALLLEQLEADYYRRALREVPDFSSSGRLLAEELAANEAQHVEALTQLNGQLGSAAPVMPRFDFGDAFASESAFMELSQTLEDTGVAAYNGAGPLIEENNILTAAGQIVQVEARHAALVRWERGVDIVDSPFDNGKPMDEIRRMVTPFVVVNSL
jgi:hypothetical protein